MRDKGERLYIVSNTVYFNVELSDV